MAKKFLPCSIEQRLLLPPDLRDWLPEGHLALCIVDGVHQLDWSAVYAECERADDRGRRGYPPAMMVALLIYAYCVGKRSSRKIERATHEDVAFRVLSGDQHPDHDSISEFRKRPPASAGGPCSSRSSATLDCRR
jgi:transposase